MVDGKLRRETVALDLGMRRFLDDKLSILGEGLSEYCFSNLYLFRNVHDYRLLAGDYPCIDGRTYDGKRSLIPLFDLADVPHQALLEIAEGFDFFSPISEQAVKKLDLGMFDVSCSRNDADYIYPADNFIHYRGKVLRKKKNLMQQYLRGGVEVISFAKDHFGHAKQVLDEWQEGKQKTFANTDYYPCLEALESFEELGLIGFMHYRDRNPTGFLLGEEVGPGVFAVHFAKGTIQVNGIFQYMFHHLAKCMEGVFTHYNFEQDLGLDNFRKTKKSYAPYRLRKKYRLRPLSG